MSDRPTLAEMTSELPGISEARVRVFVSYSHHDVEYLANDSLLGFLRGLEREGVEFWSDQRIAIGECWDEEIRTQIRASDIALVLVSQAFLDSAYCTDVEICSFLASHRKSGLTVCPVILSPCEWERHDWLQSRQVLPRAGKTLEEHYADEGGRKRLLLDLRQQLRRQIVKKRTVKAETAPGELPVEPFPSGDVTRAATASVAVGERRHMTVMCCSIGAMQSPELLDPEELMELMPPALELARRIAEDYGAYVEQDKTVGNSFTVLFGYPLAHEDDARRAVRAALRIVPDFVVMSFRLAGERATRLAIRIGIHTGVVVVAPVEGEERLILGGTGRCATSIQALTPADAIQVSEATHRLIEGAFACESAGPHFLPGCEQPMRLFRAIDGDDDDKSQVWNVATGWRVQPAARALELQLLVEQWQLVREGLGRTVLLSGEAGLGKTRLVKSLQERLVGEQRTIVECQCSPHYQNTAFFPLTNSLSRLIGVDGRQAHQDVDSLPPAGVVPRLLDLLASPGVSQHLPLEFSPEAHGQKIMESCLELFLEMAEHHPVLLVVEDLHWVDPSTLELLTQLIRQGPSVSLMLLLTFRRQFAPPWGPSERLVQLTLSPLPRQQVDKMIDGLTRGKPLPGRVRDAIIQRADGVPLFVEELTRLVVESGRRASDASHPNALVIPPTLQEWLTARLDRLGEAKQVAQLAAALGREFRFDHLLAISPLDESDLCCEIERLVDAGILFRRGLMRRATYIFKHALIRDAAHQSLLRGPRREVHQRITRVLEQCFPETVAKKPELLAYHSTESGEYDKAVSFWQQAAENAVRSSGNAEAIGHALRGLELLRAMPANAIRRQHEISLQIVLGAAMSTSKGYASPDVQAAYSRAYELRLKAADGPKLFTALDGLVFYYLCRGHLQRATQVAGELLLKAEAKEDPDFISIAHWSLGVCLFHHGEFERSRAHLDKGVTFYSTRWSLEDETMQGPYWAPWSKTKPGLALAAGLGKLSWTQWFLGHPEQALASSRQSLTLTEQFPEPFTRAFALSRACYLHVFRREPHAALELACELVEFADHHGFLFFSGVGRLLEGHARATLGEVEAGLQMASEVLDGLWATGREAGRTHKLAMVAEICALAGHTEQGLSLISEALTAAHREGERHFEAELYRIQGRLLEIRGASALEVEASFQQALYVAHQQGARSFQLRAIMSLGRLWRRQGKERQTADFVREIYGRFTEGFETPDLQDAVTLLAEVERADPPPWSR